jgi:hypothetical protein
MGVASCKWVRPDFMMASNWEPFASNETASRSKLRSIPGSVASVASRIAVGMTSLVLWAMLT